MTAMQDETEIDDQGAAKGLDVLEDTVTRHPLNREVLYRMLAFCASAPTLDLRARLAAPISLGR